MNQYFKSIIAKIGAKFRKINAEPRLVKRLLWYSGIATLCVFSSVVVFVLLIWMGFFGEIPGKDDLKSISHQVATEVYSADSVLLGRYYWQERSTVPPEEIGPALKHALVATEDARFYKHNGIDMRSLMRVLVKSIGE